MNDPKDIDFVNGVSKKSIMFAIPSYDGNVCLEGAVCLASTISALDSLKIGWTIQSINGDCYIAKARNELAMKFLKSQHTHLMFIDTDIGWQHGAVLRLLASGKDVAIGAYRLKKDEKEIYPLNVFRDAEGKIVQETPAYCGRAVRIKHGPTGFMMIERSVFERIRDKFPQLRYKAKYGDSLNSEEQINFFHCIQHGDSWVGEDISFCYNCGLVGAEIWALIDIKLAHWGRKCFTGEYGKFLDLNMGKPSDCWFDYADKPQA